MRSAGGALRHGALRCAQPKTSLGFMSRRPVASHTWHRPRLSRHAFLELHPAGLGFPIFGVHLSAVHAAWTERRRVMELGSLLRTIKGARPRLPPAGRRLQHARARRRLRRPQAADPAARAGLAERRAHPLADDSGHPQRRLRGRVPHAAPGRSRSPAFRCGIRTCVSTTCSRRRGTPGACSGARS